ncbi:N-(5'-phosphoribosyl)anthranilate isomerase [compost metagenome]
MKGVPGGTGEAFDWALVPQGLGKPIILAGGLTAENVAAAIRQVRPYAVDVSGGVEQGKGIKDPAKIRAFMAAVRNSQ